MKNPFSKKRPQFCVHIRRETFGDDSQVKTYMRITGESEKCEITVVLVTDHDNKKEVKTVIFKGRSGQVVIDGHQYRWSGDFNCFFSLPLGVNLDLPMGFSYVDDNGGTTHIKGKIVDVKVEE